MAKTVNITCCECDSLRREGVPTDTAPMSSDWHVVRRYSVDAVDMQRLLCRECFEDTRRSCPSRTRASTASWAEKGGK